jgi:hypothetical protein
LLTFFKIFSNNNIIKSTYSYDYNPNFRNITPLVAMYPSPHVVGKGIKRLSSTVCLPVENRILSQERLQSESVFFYFLHFHFLLNRFYLIQKS